MLLLGALAVLLVACGGGGGSAPVASTSACAVAAPPTGGTPGVPNTAALTWDAVTHPDLCGYRVYYAATSLPTEYRVERCKGVGCSNFVEVAQLPGTTYNDTSLDPTTSYSYRVRAADSAGSLSEYSFVASDATLTAPTAPGLVAAYAFNEGAGRTVTDASGNNNNGTINGAVWTGSGHYANALEFDGVSAQVTIPHSASLDLTTAMTLQAWVFPTVAPAGWRVIINKNNEAYFLLASSGEPNNRPGIGGTWAAGYNDSAVALAPLAVNAWTHLAATFDRATATVRLYVDGVVVATRVETTSLVPNNGTLQIGAESCCGFFTGLIDEVRIYNRALSTAEINADMNTPISPDVTPPTPPAGLTATGATAMQINLTWGASADNVGVPSYRVERCAGVGCGTFFQVATATGTTYVDTTGLLPETTYGYQVRAIDAAGNSSTPSNIAYVSTLASGTILPTAPGGLTAVAASTTEIGLTWDVSTTAQGTYVQSFGQGINAGNTTTYTLTGLSSGTRYYFAVTAVGTSNNESGFSNIVYKDIP